MSPNASPCARPMASHWLMSVTKDTSSDNVFETRSLPLRSAHFDDLDAALRLAVGIPDADDLAVIANGCSS